MATSLPAHNDRPNKFRAITVALKGAIASGKYKTGQKIPSETQLSRRFNVSRLTIGRALKELSDEGLIERKVGSGSFVRNTPTKARKTFGLLIPELGQTEIFEPICQGIARATRATQNELLWGAAPRDVESKEQDALHLCAYYIFKDVSGVFFAPLEVGAEIDEINSIILDRFDQVGIPVVLLDKDVSQSARRRRRDLVGINNRRAGQIVTSYLLDKGCRRPVFLCRSGSASTVEQRAAGYRDVLMERGLEARVEIGEPTSIAWLRRVMQSHRPDGIVCANDRTAAEIMMHMAELRVDVPQKVKVIGIDDTKYAALLSVPLTTLRQPCHDLGSTALLVMLDRIEHPTMPARDILLDCELVIRRSA